MTILQNPRHEAFARELVKGKTAVEAYRVAGYRPSRPHASRLATNGNIFGRVAELQAIGAEKAAVTVESLIAEADETKRHAIAAKQFSAAVSALTLKARLAGFLKDREPVPANANVPYVDAPPQETREQWLERRRRELARGDGRH